MGATTGGPNAIRENLYYMGSAKQPVWNTAVAPTWFAHWLDGSDAGPDKKVSKEREGDTSPFIGLMYASEQMWGIKVVEYIRPISAGFVLQALLGTGSDAYTAPTQATTLSSPIVAGASSFLAVASIGNAGTAGFNFSPGYSSTTYEVANVNLAGRTGAGPYTYPLVTGNTFKNAHLAGDVVNNNSQHVLTRQTGTYDAYTWEVAFGNTTFGQVYRVMNCVCTEVKLTSETGKPLRLEHTWWGSQSAIQAAFASVVQEGLGVVGVAGGPLVHFQAGSSWTVDGSTSGIASGVKKLELTLKNSTVPQDFQSEQLYAPYFIPGNFDIDGQLTVLFESYSQYLNTYYGSAAATTGATDSYIVGYGSFNVTWTSDLINSLAVNLPLVGYTAARLGAPKLDGKILEQNVVFSGQRTPAQPTPLTFTLNNSQNSVY